MRAFEPDFQRVGKGVLCPLLESAFSLAKGMNWGGKRISAFPSFIYIQKGRIGLRLSHALQ